MGDVPFDNETQADFVELLQSAIVLLGQFALRLLSALRVLRLPVIDLRCHANDWRTRHQRKREREDDLKDHVQLLQAEIREPNRRLCGRKSETASATLPTSQATAPPKLGLVVGRRNRRFH